MKLSIRTRAVAGLLAGTLVAAPALAHRDTAASEASALSALPIAISVALPVAVLASGAALTVVAVESVAEGSIWVLERVSDGARFSVTLGATAVAGASLLVGTGVVAVACSTGWVLSTAGRALAFIPNEIGRGLLFNERVTR